MQTLNIFSLSKVLEIAELSQDKVFGPLLNKKEIVMRCYYVTKSSRNRQFTLSF